MACLTPRCASSATPTPSSPAKSTCRCCRSLRLFDPALGMTTVVPEFDPRRPAAVAPGQDRPGDPAGAGVTNSFGSPTLWRKIADHCLAHGLDAAEPAPRALRGRARAGVALDRCPAFSSHGQLHSPYGATEVLPVSTVTAEEIDPCLGPRRLRGTPAAGKPGEDHRASPTGPIATLAAARELPPGEIGEIIVTGPTVTREYDQLPEATASAKIRIQPPNAGIFPEPEPELPRSGLASHG